MGWRHRKRTIREMGGSGGRSRDLGGEFGEEDASEEDLMLVCRISLYLSQLVVEEESLSRWSRLS